ncbi:MAG TPA: 4-(cytidine 5'-diphospho)-2-C-methyl-D-erythritol kinase [Spirochaetota bacterium]|nr:4-(cytidine 5'-diphospho)-2-C-methyl-D-erythritol kinase [Spirochaetota bacterium]
MKEIHSYGKINLFLDVVDLYKNGYHKINSVFMETKLFDVISFEKNDLGKIRVFDKSNTLPEENLLKKAADKLINLTGKTRFGVDFYIEKKIPIGGGMGGGSSNAASVLKILNSLWELKYSNKNLQNIGKSLGADVPFFINGGIQKVTGIGEILKPLKTPKIDLEILLVLPGISVSTPLAYKLIDSSNLCKKTYENNKKLKNLIEGLIKNNYKMIIENIYNKFETVVFKEYPMLEEIRDNIIKSGADKSFMSGSGSTMVGIYSDREKKDRALKYLNNLNYKVIRI